MGATLSSQPQVSRRRLQQRTVDTRLKIIRSALSEFARLGFETASTRGIAEAAGVQHSLVLYHFGSKDELWYDAVKEAVSWYSRREFGVVRPVQGGDPVTALKRNFAYYIRFTAKYPELFRIMTHENALRSDRLAWFVANHVRPTVGYLIELIRRAQAQRGFIQGDPLRLIYLFHGAATSPYRSAWEIEMLTGEQQSSERAVRRHIQLCERLFFPKSK
jgi:TetR/AcrR family transcriptional regulator